MNNVDNLFLEHIESEKFQHAISDDFSFVDSLIDQRDLDKINDIKEEI